MAVQETGLYYLQSRYYDPEIGRFINADAFTSTGQGLLGNNMFAYCGNNPVDRLDSAGTAYLNVSACREGGEAVPLRYKSVEDAAKAFAIQNYSASYYTRYEYGAVIYAKTVNGVTTYDYTTPFAGTPHDITFDNVQIPYGTTAVATVHTHPLSSNPSGVYLGSGEQGDTYAARQNNLDAYIVGVDRHLSMVSVSAKKVYHYNEVLPVIPLTAKEKSQLRSQFGMLWDTHSATCTKGCHNVPWPRD